MQVYILTNGIKVLCLMVYDCFYFVMNLLKHWLHILVTTQPSSSVVLHVLSVLSSRTVLL